MLNLLVSQFITPEKVSDLVNLSKLGRSLVKFIRQISLVLVASLIPGA